LALKNREMYGAKMEFSRRTELHKQTALPPWHMLHCTTKCGIRTLRKQALYAQCNTVTRSRNRCCHGNATTRSLCIVVDSQVAVSDLKPLSVVIETQWLPSALLSRSKPFRTVVGHV